MKNGSLDPFSASLVFQLGGGLVFLIWLIFAGEWQSVPYQTWWNWIILAVAYGTGTLFIFKTLQIMDSGEANVLFSSRAFVTILLSVLLLHEVVTLKLLVGTCLIITAIFLVSTRNYKIHFNRGWAFGLIAAFCYGVALTNDAYIFRQYSIPIAQFLVLGFILPGIYLMLLKPHKIKGGLPIFTEKKFAIVIITSILLYAISSYTYYSALELGVDASKLAPFNQSSVILTVWMAALFLGEKSQLLQKSISAVLVSLGAYLLI